MDRDRKDRMALGVALAAGQQSSAPAGRTRMLPRALHTQVHRRAGGSAYSLEWFLCPCLNVMLDPGAEEPLASLWMDQTHTPGHGHRP